MIRSTGQVLVNVCVVTVLWAAPTSCEAHFLWLKTIDQGNRPQAFLFFGETAGDEAYHLPERLAKTEVWRRAKGERTKLETDSLETDDRIGLVAPLDGEGPCVLEATQTYGVYGTSLLTYYAKHVRAGSGKQLNAAGKSKELKFQIVPRTNEGRLELVVLWKGEPLSGAEVSIAVGDEEAVERTTDKDGRASLEQEGEGLVAVLANYLDTDDSGEHDGKQYKGVLHYASLTFELPTQRGQAHIAPRTPHDHRGDGARPVPAAVPALPEPVSSFGAAVADGWLYVYSGHTGEEHQHSAANLSQHFCRIQLEGGTEWEDLPMQIPLQGLAMVAHGGKVYRVGGLNARNATTDDDEDLHSVADFAEFDPSTGEWRSLAPLPAPRSSHNAVVMGDRLYVVGGWHLHGESPGDWQTDALVYDFADPQAGWQRLPAPPFTRRALAVGHWQEQLVAIGGIDEKGDVSQRVDFFDPLSGEWSTGPDLPGAGLAGFGGSACNLDGRLYVSGLRGIVYLLNDKGSAWDEAGRMERGRFFHQLLPAEAGSLLAIGGASRKGHLADVELVDVSEDK